MDFSHPAEHPQGDTQPSAEVALPSFPSLHRVDPSKLGKPPLPRKPTVTPRARIGEPSKESVKFFQDILPRKAAAGTMSLFSRTQTSQQKED